MNICNLFITKSCINNCVDGIINQSCYTEICDKDCDLDAQCSNLCDNSNYCFNWISENNECRLSYNEYRSSDATLAIEGYQAHYRNLLNNGTFPVAGGLFGISTLGALIAFRKPEAEYDEEDTANSKL